MTDVLGPCPVCRYAGTHVTVGESQRRTLCGRAACTFMCSTEHWSLLRRKMTRDEANDLVHGVAMYAAKDEFPNVELEAAWDRCRDAITGETP